MVGNIFFRILFFFLASHAIFAQIKISGKILSEVDKSPIEFGSLAVLEIKVKITFKNGIYSIELPKAGGYTFKINSPGFADFQKKINIIEEQNLDFYLPPATIRTRKLRVRGHRKTQRLSRNTLTQEELKSVPATYDDPLEALASLPGVIRASQGDLFGPLIIRGASEFANRYYIDGIPVLYPQHFGNLQSVISNELIEKIDLYSSSSPVGYGEALGAVIDISTKEAVEDFNGKVLVSFISSDFYLEDIIRNKEPDSTDSQTKKDEAGQKNGYWIASGRISYLSLTLSLILPESERVKVQLPQYYDYQIKGKYFLDDSRNHSVSMLFFGFYDTLKFQSSKPTEEEKQEAIDGGEDPLLFSSGLDVRNEIFSNNLGLYYRYHPSAKLNNQLIVFSALNDSRFFLDIASLAEQNLNAKTIDLDIKPNFSGVKNTLEWSWWQDYAYLKFGLEATLYYFSSQGVAQATTRLLPGQTADLADDSLFRGMDVDFSKTNLVYSSSLENTFDIAGFSFVPGIRLSFLQLTEDLVYDPRALLTYTFDWDMLLSGAYGLYSSFPQINYFLFNQSSDIQPDVVRSESIEPEKARHASLGIEQSFSLFSVKAEGFYNIFTDQLIENPDPREEAVFINSADARAQGVELSFRLDREEKRAAFYGWISYTLSGSKRRTNLPLNLDPNGNSYLSTLHEQPHSLKLILGYIWDINEVGARFQLNSGSPYTPIVGGRRNDNLTNIERYSPTYGDPLSKRYPLVHRLDIRYTRTVTHTWGSTRWYVEIINVYYSKSSVRQEWDYNKPYEEGSNPELAPGSVLFIPNFGVEMRF